MVATSDGCAEVATLDEPFDIIGSEVSWKGRVPPTTSCEHRG